MKINIFLFEFEIMSFWTSCEKTKLNFNDTDIFTDYQIGYFSFRKYKSNETKKLWIS